MVAEITHISNINNREDLIRLFKVYSKKHNSFMDIVLFLEFISMDQIKKLSCTLFAGGNSKVGATFA